MKTTTKKDETQKGMALYDITDTIAKLQAQLEASGGDVTEGSEGEILAEMIEAFKSKEVAKVDAYFRLYTEWEVKAEAIRAEEKRLAQRRRKFENAIKNLKDLAKRAMEAHGIDKLEGNIGDIVRQRNGGVPSVTWKVPVDQLPKYLLRVIEEPNAEAARGLLLDGDEEVKEYAELGDVGYSVRFR